MRETRARAAVLTGEITGHRRARSFTSADDEIVFHAARNSPYPRSVTLFRGR